MSKAKLNWVLFEKAAAAVKQAGGQAGSQHAPEAVRGGGTTEGGGNPAVTWPQLSAFLGSMYWKDYVNREKAKSMWGDKVEIGGTDVRGTSKNPYLGDASTFRAYENLPEPKWHNPMSWAGPLNFEPENLSTGVRGPNRAD